MSTTEKVEVTNWSGLQTLANKSNIVRAASEADVIAIVEQYELVRPIGSLFSYEPIQRINDDKREAALIDISAMQGVIEHDEDTVSFWAGTRIDHIVALLKDMNRDLTCCPGVIGVQTIAGGISTGTHGQGMSQSTIADALRSIRVVLANGTATTINKTDAHFGAFITSLGCLGVITQVTLETRPARVFTSTKYSIDKEKFRQDFVKINQESEFAKGWWFPDSGLVHIWEVNEANQKDAETYLNGDGSLITTSTTIDTTMNESVEKSKEDMRKDTKTDKGRQFETVERFKDAVNVTGSLTQILCKGIPVPQINCELAVPLEYFPQIVDALQHWYETTSKRLHYPFIFRCHGPSQAWLSGAYQRNTCWIGFVVYLASDGNAVEGGFESINELQQLLAKFEGIPHIGKSFQFENFDFYKMLPNFARFNDLRISIDPEGKFSNKWIEKFFEKRQITTDEMSTA